jgi:hypothetical protein
MGMRNAECVAQHGTKKRPKIFENIIRSQDHSEQEKQQQLKTPKE